MGDFLGIMLAIIFSVTPKEVDRVQIWPYAGDTNQHAKELSLTFRKTEHGWCPDDGETNQNRCVTISDGKWLDEHGKVLLEIKDNLKISNGTNYVFGVKGWDNPIEFSVVEGKDERTFALKGQGKKGREIKVKSLKSKQVAPANRQ